MKKKLYIFMLSVAMSVLVVSSFGLSKISATVPGTNQAIDQSTSGGIPNSYAFYSASSQDGRYIAFQSASTNLTTPSTTGSSYQIFIRDRLTSTTTLVSQSASGSQGNSYSQSPRISADGRYVVFESNASNLVGSDTNSTLDTFIRDTALGTTTRVSTSSSGSQANAGSQSADVSADGKYVVFESYATNLVSSPTVSSGGHIYLKNMTTGAVQLISQSSSGSIENGDSFYPRISCEGRTILFQSYANNLVSGDTNNPNKTISRIYTVDMLKPVDPIYLTGTNNGNMAYGSISCNGNYIAFVSDASNLVGGDTNSVTDIFVYDRIKNTFDRVSVSSTGIEGNDTSSNSPSISNDGKYVAFNSAATNLVAGDTNGYWDIFLRNRQAGTTELVSKGPLGALANGDSILPEMSSDGKYISYSSSANNLVSGFNNTNWSIFTSQSGTGYDY